MMASLTVMAQTAANEATPAQFPGGDGKMTGYIEQNLQYPAAALRNGIEGVVEVRFIVKTDGTREQLTIVRLVDPDLETEAIRLVDGMPAWIPAMSAGKPIDSETNVRIPFMLPDQD